MIPPNIRKPVFDLEKAFRFKGSFEFENKHCTIEVDSLPNLVLSSGKIAIGDPFEIERVSLHRKVKPGIYAVERAARRDTFADSPVSWAYEVACMRVLFSKSRPVRWASAMPSEKFSGSIAGRANCCCMADAHAVRQLSEPAVSGESPVFDLVNASSDGPVILDQETGANLVNSGFLGYGTGPVGAFWGIDSKERICRLVLDFGNLSETIVTTKTVATVEELIGNSVTLKTRVGTFEITGRTVPRKKEVHIKVTGPGCTHLEWNVQQPKRKPQLQSWVRSTSGTEALEQQFRRLHNSGPLDYPFTVTYPSGVRPLF